MKKLLKVFLIIAIILAFFTNLTVLAAENEATTRNNTPQTATNATSNTSTDTTTTTSSTKQSTRVSSVASINEGELSISDILNILLIAVGIVIILLAIAIFIKLK